MSSWLSLWQWNVVITLILGVMMTAWFLIGGIVDVRTLFRDLARRKRNDSGDGTVCNGQNAGER